MSDTDFFRWNEARLALKVPELDTDRQSLIQRMNAIHQAHVRAAGKDDTLRLLKELISGTTAYFNREEAYLEKIKFDQVVTHKKTHKQILDQLSKHTEELERKGSLGETFFGFLNVWVVSHMHGADSKFVV